MSPRLIRARRMVALLAAVAWVPAGSVWAHPAAPPPAPAEPPPEVEPIPEEDQDLYHSRVTAIKPALPGLSARILDGDERLELIWKGEPPLVVEGTQGEPMLRLGSQGVEINGRSPSAYLSGDRYAQVAMPSLADAKAPPAWRPIDTPGPISWYEHRAHWLEDERPPIVGDGDTALTIFHWRVPVQLGTRRVEIIGVLDWVPDPGAIRADRSAVSSPALSAAILIAAMTVGAGIGVLVRRRVEESPAQA